MLRIGTWNTEWAAPKTVRGALVRDQLADAHCDILCISEGSAGLLPSAGHIIDAGSDWGCPITKGKEHRRKVLLWSRKPWKKLCLFDERPLAGRFVAATTQTDAGALDVVGVCIPWRDAHVSTCQKDRKRWEEHIQWLEAFDGLGFPGGPARTVVMGDFNQRVPRRRQNREAYAALRRAFAGFTITTAGWLSAPGALAIDHIAHTPNLRRMGDIGVWPGGAPTARIFPIISVCGATSMTFDPVPQAA